MIGKKSLDKLAVATHNRGKLFEIKQLVGDLSIKVISAEELGGDIPDETGTSYKENAIIKAINLYKRCGLPTLADDSGLEVRSLNGMPGVYSARFDGPKATYISNNKKMLSMLQGIDDRRAQFVCVMVLVVNGAIYQSIGKVAGVIAYEAKGIYGFGYDPLFIPIGYHVSFADLSYKKRFISHRAIALKKMKTIIRRKCDF